MDCNWDNPGHNPYTGTIAAAIAKYDIPNEARAELIRKAAKVQFDTVVEIRRDGMRSRDGRFTDLRDMHFGRTVCRGPVMRSKWDPGHLERALVYCAGIHCIAVPFVCRNVSLITMHEMLPLPAPAAEPYIPAPFVMPKDKKVRAIPEPSTYMLALAALAGIAFTRRKG